MVTLFKPYTQPPPPSLQHVISEKCEQDLNELLVKATVTLSLTKGQIQQIVVHVLIFDMRYTIFEVHA